MSLSYTSLTAWYGYMTPTIISFIPNLINEAGHEFIYNIAVNDAASMNGWQYYAAVPDDCAVEPLPATWTMCLKVTRKKNIFTSKIERIYLYTSSVYKFFKSKIIRDKTVVIFLESFLFYQLLGLFIVTLFLSRKKILIWLLYRNNYKLTLLDKILNSGFKRLFRSKICLFTDSELLQKSLSHYFNQFVYVLPIPHTQVAAENAFIKKTNQLVCWWPGPPRENKGLETIRKISAIRCVDDLDLRLLVSKKAQIESSKNAIAIDFVNDPLPREEYLKLLSMSDVILLPYDQTVYAESTSGVFVEAIVAGKIPLVSDKTWMAFELRKNNLEELIIDWNRSDILKLILDISKNADVHSKISKMRNLYKTFHNLHSFAHVMQFAFNESRT